MEGPCFRCGSSNVFHITIPHHYRGIKREDVWVCENCPYGQCRSCDREYNIDQLGVASCQCGAEDLCYACRPTSVASDHVCTICNFHTTLVVCPREGCKTLADLKCAKQREICNICEQRVFCTHPVLSYGFYPWSGKDVSQCEFLLPRGYLCAKFICTACCNGQLRCKDHRDC